jgi:hypothetical protein
MKPGLAGLFFRLGAAEAVGLAKIGARPKR